VEDGLKEPFLVQIITHFNPKWNRLFPPKGAKYSKTGTPSSSYEMAHVRKIELGGTIEMSKCVK
jgi:hypothetical protein